MASTMVPIPAGALFYVSAGAYSDYRVQGIFRATSQIDVETLREEWLTRHPEQREPYSFKDGDFLASMSALMEPVDSWELFLGCYASAGEMDVLHVSDG